ncbi:unnamed protein product [Polarella glacialis]|uniref:Uncharacterized protein n=1 Tax=Polarella glacialis TaxID=89957 RepID=A0A813JNR9_POLGL|nr:unnamed protein product [Polarella glacialis]
MSGSMQVPDARPCLLSEQPLPCLRNAGTGSNCTASLWLFGFQPLTSARCWFLPSWLHDNLSGREASCLGDPFRPVLATSQNPLEAASSCEQSGCQSITALPNRTQEVQVIRPNCASGYDLVIDLTLEKQDQAFKY